jgi:predicted kinase
MIHHVSIPAREPQHVAEVLAELMAASAIRSDRWRAPLWQRAATRTEL